MSEHIEPTDPYLDPETGLLRNRVGARTKADLDNAEADLSFARLVQLTDRPSRATGDLDELRVIHRHLFQDVYDWAGEIRIVDIRKNAEGAESFMPMSLIDRASVFAAEQLHDDLMLRGLPREQFIERLAHHYEQVNYIHPFREGNGRAQRVFWNRVAGDAGWQLDWRPVRGEVNDLACRLASDQRDFGPLRDMFGQITSPAAPEVKRDDAWRAAEVARMSFPTSDTQSP